MRFIGFFMLFTSTRLFAVEVAKCPDTLSAKLTDISPFSESDIRKQLDERAISEEDTQWYLKRLGQSNIRWLTLRNEYDEPMRLTSAKKGECRYGNSRGDIAKFYTTEGRSIVRVMKFVPQYILDGAMQLGYYVTIDAYSKADGWTLQPGQSATVMVSVDDHAGEFSGVVKIGKSTALTVTK